jgi:hypothetical protein
MKRKIIIDEINRGKNYVQGKWFVTRQIYYFILYFFQIYLYAEKSTHIYITVQYIYIVYRIHMFKTIKFNV